MTRYGDLEGEAEEAGDAGGDEEAGKSQEAGNARGDEEARESKEPGYASGAREAGMAGGVTGEAGKTGLAGDAM